MSIAEQIIKMRRLAVLQVLTEESDFSSNERNLDVVLRHMGHKTTRDQLRDYLAYLETERLVTLEKVPAPSGDELWMARVTEMGQRVAKGFERYTGIARPGEV